MGLGDQDADRIRGGVEVEHVLGDQCAPIEAEGRRAATGVGSGNCAFGIEPARLEPIPPRGEGSLGTVDRVGQVRGRDSFRAVEDQRCPHHLVVVDGRLERARRMGDREVVAAGRADERHDDLSGRVRAHPRAGVALGLERHPGIGAAIGGAVRCGRDRGRGTEGRPGPGQLAEDIEGQLQSTGRTAVRVLVATAMGIDHPVGVEACAGRAERIDPAADPGTRPLIAHVVVQCERGEFDGECRRKHASGASPRNRGTVGTGDGVDEVKRRARTGRPTPRRAAARAVRRTARCRRCRCRTGPSRRSSRPGCGAGSG